MQTQAAIARKCPSGLQLAVMRRPRQDVGPPKLECGAAFWLSSLCVPHSLLSSMLQWYCSSIFTRRAKRCGCRSCLHLRLLLRRRQLAKRHGHAVAGQEAVAAGQQG